MERMELKSERIIEKGSSAFISTMKIKIISQLISLAAIIVLVRSLSQADYGIYNLLYSSIVMLTIFTSFGISNVLQRFIPEYCCKGEYKRANKLLKNTSLIRFFTTLILLTIVVLLWDRISPSFGLENYKYLFLQFIFIIIIEQQCSLFELTLIGNFFHSYTLVVILIFSTVKLVGYVIVLFSNYGLETVIFIDSFAYGILFSSLLFVYKKKFPDGRNDDCDYSKKEIKRIVRYGAFYNFNDVGTKVLGVDIDNYLIAFFLDPAAVGIYSFYTRISKMINRFLPITFFQNVFRPIFFGLGHSSENKDKALGFSLLMKIQYFIALPVFFVVMTIAPEMIELLFGDKYNNSIDVFIAIFAFTIIGGFTGPVSIVAQLEEKAGIIFFSKIFMIYNLIAAILLTPYFGVVGVAIATGTAKIFKDLFIWFFVRDVAKVDKFASFIFKTILFWGLFFTLLYHLKSGIHNKSYFVCLVLIATPIAYRFYFMFDLFSKKENLIICRLIAPYNNTRIVKFLAYSLDLKNIGVV